MGVKTDAGLIQYISAAHQAAAQTRAQLNALAFATTQCGRSPIEREVSQSHIEQELQAVFEFNEQPVGNGAFIVGEGQPAQHLLDFIDGARQQVGEGMAIDTHIGCLGLQSASPAGVACRAPAVAAEHDPVLDFVALGFEPRKEVVDAFPPFVALPQHPTLRSSQLYIGGVHREVGGVSVFQELLLVPAGFFAAPWGDGISVDRFRRIGDHQVLTDADDMAKALATGTGSLGAVETEQVWRGPFKCHAVELKTVAERIGRGRAICCYPMQQAFSLTLIKGRVHGVC